MVSVAQRLLEDVLASTLPLSVHAAAMAGGSCDAALAGVCVGMHACLSLSWHRVSMAQAFSSALSKPPGVTRVYASAGSVVCCGLSCLDLMLVGASGDGKDFGAIHTFSKQVGAVAALETCSRRSTRKPLTWHGSRPCLPQVFCPGGSAPQTSLALGLMGVEVCVLTKVGNDVHGQELIRQLQASGARAQPYEGCVLVLFLDA